MTEHLIAVCKLCGHTVRISLEHGGRRAKCPKCEGIIDIPKGETSIRLRSDRELTREAKAKAGRPDSEPVVSAAGGPPDRPTRVRRVAVKPPSPARKWSMIVTLVATAAIVAGIAIVLLRKPKNQDPSSAPPAPPAKTAPPSTSPPPSVTDKFAASRTELMVRLENFLKAFNTHNLARMKPFYTCDEKTLMTAFKNFGLDTEVSYEKPDAKIDFKSDDEADMTLSVDRILTDTQEKKSTTERVERKLKWERKEGKWLISSTPEP